MLAVGDMGSAMKQSLTRGVARRVRGCLPWFITFVFVSDVDLALVRHFFLHDEEGVLRQLLMGSQWVMGKLGDERRAKRWRLADIWGYSKHGHIFQYFRYRLKKKNLIQLSCIKIRIYVVKCFRGTDFHLQQNYTIYQHLYVCLIIYCLFQTCFLSLHWHFVFIDACSVLFNVYLKIMYLLGFIVPICLYFLSAYVFIFL